MDPYDFASQRLPSDTRAKITAFWEHFVRHADGLDRCFTSKMQDMSTDPSEVLKSLAEVSPDLMWEFGPSQKGHSLCITAEWNDDNLVLARAMLQSAPDLPRWEFVEARKPSPSDFTAQNFEARFRTVLTLTKLEAQLNANGKIDVIGHGKGSQESLDRQTFAAAAMIVGEEFERNWLGVCGGKRDGGLFGRLWRSKDAEPDGNALLDQFRTQIARARDLMPDHPLSAGGWSNRGRWVMGLGDLPPDHPRQDLMTYNTTNEAYAKAALGGGVFSSSRLSNFGEWFACLRMERTADAPFDTAEERGDVEELLHGSLENDAVGGVVGSGHGREAVYFDIGGPDAAKVVGAVTRFLSDKPYGQASKLTFLDRGLTSFSLDDFGPKVAN